MLTRLTELPRRESNVEASAKSLAGLCGQLSATPAACLADDDERAGDPEKAHSIARHNRRAIDSGSACFLMSRSSDSVTGQ
jgi:hypothetical protein